MARSRPQSSQVPPRPRRRRGRRRLASNAAGAVARRRILVVLVGAATALGLAGAVTLAARALDTHETACPDGRRELTVAAAPEIAAPVAAAVAAEPDLGECLVVRVAASLPADIAAALPDDGTGQTGRLPDVWIPDSSLWLTDPAASADRSVAQSPLVLAVPRALATELGWPDVALEVPQLFEGGGGARLALADPARSAATRAGLLALNRALSPLPDGRGRLGATYRAADRSLPADPDAALQAATGPETTAATAVFVPEQAVWASNTRPDRGPVVAGYPADLPALDYPFVVLAEHRDARSDAERLRAALAGPDWLARATEAGFRAPDGTAGGTLARHDAVRSDVAGARVPDAQEVRGAVDAFRTITLGSRLLAVLDISGSMAAEVPGEPPRTRMELAVGAAAKGLALYPDDAQVGLWVFSTDLGPAGDHRELVPVGPLGMQPDGVRGREKVAAALAGVQHLPRGDTGLYDTVLAAVRAVREGWEPESVNSVVVLTDGQNDDPAGIALEQLLATLEAEAGDRPVAVIGIALGAEGDLDALREIAQVTRGAAYEVQDVRMVQQVLANALSQRPCRPNC